MIQRVSRKRIPSTAMIRSKTRATKKHKIQLVLLCDVALRESEFIYTKLWAAVFA